VTSGCGPGTRGLFKKEETPDDIFNEGDKLSFNISNRLREGAERKRKWKPLDKGKY